MSTSDASQPGGRLAYVGLSGGFGTLSLGQIWSASYNHAGVIRDIGNWLSSSDTSARVGNAVSYAFSSDAASFQVDAIMDGGKDTDSAIDQVEFGVTVNMGDIGKIALSYTDVNDASTAGMKTGVLAPHSMLTANDAGMFDKSELDVRDKTTGKPIVGTIASVAHTIGGKAAVLRQVYTNGGVADNVMGSPDYKMAGGKLYASSCLTDAGVPETGDDACEDTTWAYVQTMNTGAEEGKVTTTHNIFVVEDEDNLLMVMDTPGADAVGTPTTAMPRMVTVVRTDNAATADGVVDVEGVSHIITVNSATGLGMQHGEQVSVYSQMGDGGTADDTTDDTMVVAYGGVDAEGDPVFYAADGSLITNTRAAGSYYLGGDDDDVLMLAMAAEADDVSVTTPVMDNVPNSDYKPAGQATMHTVAHTVTMNTKDMDYGHTQTGISAELNLGVMTLGLGYSKTESNDPMDMMDAKTTYLGASGGIGDTGMGWRAWARNMEDHKGMESTPWGIGLDKALGGGAKAYIEHANADDGASGTTVMALRVDF